MRWSLRQACPFQHYYVKSGTRIENRRAFVFIKHIRLLTFFKWLIVSLDKTLIHRLISFTALWSCTETVILTFNRLESIETNYMDTTPGVFISKTLIYFRLRKEIHKHLGWHDIFWLVICIAKNLIWTTLKAIFSIFVFVLHSQIPDIQIVVYQSNTVLTNHTSTEGMYKSQCKKIDTFDWFCGPGHISLRKTQ